MPSTDQAVTATATTAGCVLTLPTLSCTGTQPGSGPLATQPCDEESNFCEGTSIVGDTRFCTEQPYSEQCCNGRWMSASRLDDGGVPECPPPPEPGSPFDCGDGAASCSLGETYCSSTTDPQDNTTFACPDLCSVADCSCFCTPDSFGGCTFEPADEETLEDGCTCSNEFGAITLRCHYYGLVIPAACARDLDYDASCLNPDIRGTAYACTATSDDPDPYPRLSCDFGGSLNETTWYCCADE